MSVLYRQGELDSPALSRLLLRQGSPDYLARGCENVAIDQAELRHAFPYFADVPTDRRERPHSLPRGHSSNDQRQLVCCGIGRENPQRICAFRRRQAIERVLSSRQVFASRRRDPLPNALGC